MADQFPDRQAPLLDALLAHAQSGRSGWHTPGHNAGRAWPEWFRQHLTDIDLTELPATDDLNRPTGPARQAMELAAEACGAGLTRFITGGATTAIHIMLACTVGLGGALMVARTCHRSVLHAAALLNLAILPLQQTGFPPPDEIAQQPRLTLLPQATAADVDKALADNPHCRAILLTSPDYYGGCAATRAIAQVVHRRGALLLVDEAHGAHLSFDQDHRLPQSALAAGADACVQSCHKTLPVLTGGAFLHIGRTAAASGRLAAAGLDRLIPVFQTSSPPFPIAASLDFARWQLSESGAARINQQMAYLAAFRGGLHSRLTCQPDRTTARPVQPDSNGLDRDPLRLVITTRDEDDVSAIPWLARQLYDNGVDIEFSDLTRLVLIPSLWQQESEWIQLARILHAAAASTGSADRSQNVRSRSRCSRRLLALEATWLSAWQPARLAQQVLPLQEALLADRPVRQAPLAETAGLTAARTVAPYPPGIALIWPGERIDQDSVDFMRLLLENNISISGIDAGKVQVFA
jgi:arginine/lysine/ornithine decarboxylase